VQIKETWCETTTNQTHVRDNQEKPLLPKPLIIRIMWNTEPLKRQV